MASLFCMKEKIIIVVLFLLPAFSIAQEQVLIGIKYLTPLKLERLPRSTYNTPFTLYGGYSDNRGLFSYDVSLNIDYMPLEFNIDEENNFDGATLFLSLAVLPQIKLLNTENWTISAGTQLKAGNYYGIGNVYKSYSEGRSYIETQRKFAGFGIAISPQLIIERPGHSSYGISFGWDNTHYGKGLKTLKSQYYQPITIDASILSLGLYAKFGLKNE